MAKTEFSTGIETLTIFLVSVVVAVFFSRTVKERMDYALRQECSDDTHNMQPG